MFLDHHTLLRASVVQTDDKDVLALFLSFRYFVLIHKSIGRQVPVFRLPVKTQR